MGNPWNFLAGIFFLMFAVLLIHLGYPAAAIGPGAAAVIYFGATLSELL